MSRYLIDRIEADTRIVVRSNTRIVGLEGADVLSAVRIDGPTGEERLATTALFSFIGADPASQWLAGSAALDDWGFVLDGPVAGTRASQRSVEDARTHPAAV